MPRGVEAGGQILPDQLRGGPALLEQPAHRALLQFDKELNALYRGNPVLYANDHDPSAFGWIDLHNAEQSVFAFMRRCPGQSDRPPLLCVFNCTPVPRNDYWLGVPEQGTYRKVLDTDAARFGGSSYNHQDHAVAQLAPCQGHPHHIRLNLPPLAAMFFEPER